MKRYASETEPPASRAGRVIGAGALFEVREIHEGGRALVEKRLHARVRREPRARAALAREAHVLAAIRHPALPELVRVGSDERGPFLVETLVVGTSVRALVESWAEAGRGGVPARLAAHVTLEAFRVLAELSEQAGAGGPLSPVHGDITPDHVLVGPAGEVRLVDFGAARIRGLPAALIGEDRGTLPFAAPEVARGEAPPSPAADVYSMAATALFLSAGEAVCAAREAAAMLLEVGTRGVRTELFERVRAFRPREKEALAAALAVDPAARAASAAEIVAAFE
jgi:serine/threonine-protein kinase